MFVCAIAMGRAKDLKILHMGVGGLMEDIQVSVELSLEACQARTVHKSNLNLFLSIALKLKFKAKATHGDGSQPNFYSVCKKVPFTQAFPIFDFTRAHLPHWSQQQLIIASLQAESTW